MITFEHDPVTALRKLSSGEWNGVSLTNEISVNYLNHMNKSSRQIEFTRDALRTIDPVFYFQKHSILTRMFNEKIQICQESGLTKRWISQYTHKLKKVEHKEPKKLGMPSVIAILKISAAMYLLAFIVFLLEMFKNSHKRIEQFLDFLTY